jgi:hypothetical protein
MAMLAAVPPAGITIGTIIGAVGFVSEMISWMQGGTVKADYLKILLNKIIKLEAEIKLLNQHLDEFVLEQGD